MTKVTKGTLSGERPTGYESYTSNYGVGPSVAVRRGVPVTALPTVGTSLTQKQQKASFAAATKIYSKYNALQKDFFKRWWLIDKTIDPQTRIAKRIITGRRLAMHDIARTTSTSGTTYPKPLGFCICAVDMYGNPALEHELNITCPKLGNFTYKEQNDNFACFTPSALSAKYEPYHLFYTDAADYCLLTAEQIHKIKTLSVVKQKEVFKQYKTWHWFIGAYQGLYSFNFQELNIFTDEVEAYLIWHYSLRGTNSVNLTLGEVGVVSHANTILEPGLNKTAILHHTIKDGFYMTRSWYRMGSGYADLETEEIVAFKDEKPC